MERERRAGIRDERPRYGAIGAAAGLGGFWGFVGYTVLWSGTPFTVGRAFVVSTFGSLVLLPIRLVLGGIHAAESTSGRTFSFPDNNLWIGIAASIVGAVLVLAAFLLARTILRAVRSRA